MNLHKEFVRLSFDIIKMKNRLISLLLEIYEKEIYKQYHCKTIHEYGFKYAKLSKEMVDKVIRTLKHLENKPFLKQAIETQGIHKVAMVATIATPEDERIFAKHVENLSKPALFEFSKELRRKQQNEKLADQETLFSGQAKDAQKNGAERASAAEKPGASGAPQFCQAVPSKMTIELDEEMQILFLKFKGKYAKNLSNREALRVILKKIGWEGDRAEGKGDGAMNGMLVEMEGNRAEVRENEAINIMQVKADVENREADANTKSKTSETGVDCGNSVPGNGNQKHHEGANSSKSMSKITFPSRHIQKKKDREIRAKYQHKCAYPGCVKTIEVMHHRVPFAFERSHESVIPLCDIHHEFSHNGLIAHELLEPENWKLKTEGSTSIFDQLYLKNRRG